MRGLLCPNPRPVHRNQPCRIPQVLIHHEAYKRTPTAKGTVNKDDRVFTLSNRREVDRNRVRLHCDKNWRIEITGRDCSTASCSLILNDMHPENPEPKNTTTAPSINSPPIPIPSRLTFLLFDDAPVIKPLRRDPCMRLRVGIQI